MKNVVNHTDKSVFWSLIEFPNLSLLRSLNGITHQKLLHVLIVMKTDIL